MKKNRTEKITQNGALFLQPYLGMVVAAILAIILWFVAETGKRTDIVLALIFATLIISVFTWKTSQHRRDFGRYHAVVSVAATGAWIIAAVSLKPWNATVALTWLLGGLTLCLTWNIRLAIRTEDRQSPIDDFFKDNGLPGTRLRITSTSADIIKATASLVRGQGTVDALQRLKGRMASLFGVPANGIRIVPDPDNAAKAYITVVRRDMLKNPIPYQWELKEALTPNDPIIVGIYEDSNPVTFSLHSQTLGSAHMLIQGANGSGKSEFAKVMFAEIFKRIETELWIVDTVKGSQTLGLVLDAADWVINNEKTADILFKKFAKIIKVRADHLGKRNLTKWQPGCGLSFIYLHIEEASGLVADNPAFIKMMETARSVGIQITTSLQRASFVSIDTQARAQFAAVACFGVMDLADAQFALPTDVIEAGANPAVWRNSKPGYCYLVHPTIKDELWVMPLRTFKIDDEVLRNAAANRIPNELDPITAAAIGDLYQTNIDEDESESIEEETDEEIQYKIEKELEELTSSYSGAILEFEKQQEMSPEQAMAVLNKRLEDMRAAKIYQFNAAELSDVLIEAGRSRAWLHKRLSQLVEQKILDKDGFTYTLI